jgi:hypothetical protein
MFLRLLVKPTVVAKIIQGLVLPGNQERRSLPCWSLELDVRDTAVPLDEPALHHHGIDVP